MPKENSDRREHATVAELPFHKATMDVVCDRVPTGDASPPVMRPRFNIDQLVVHHSPSGFEWGFGGSGPSDFALNVLEVFARRVYGERATVRCFAGQCTETAWRLHQLFKLEFILKLPREGGTIPGTVIREWIESHRADGPAAAELPR